MKRKRFVLIGVVCIFSLLVSCNNAKPIKPNTPGNALFLLSMAINSNNYDSFNALFYDGNKNVTSKESLTEYSSKTTAGSDHKLYGLITYSNGEMFLAKLSVNKIDGEYKVEDLVKVPEEMKKLFEEK
jgi:hypothetical protein